MNNEMGFSIEFVADGLQKAREYRGISLKDTAEMLGISSSVVRNYEKGKYFPSLPVLESLSYIYHIPLNVLISPEALEEYTNQPNAEQLQQLLELRHNIVSTYLQIAFEESGLSQKDLVKAAGVSRSKIRRYLDGEEIPLDDLKKIAKALDINLAQYLDKESQIGIWQVSQAAYKKFGDLPIKIQEFLRESKSWDFINSAYSLSSIDQNELETMANALAQLRDILEERS